MDGFGELFKAIGDMLGAAEEIGATEAVASAFTERGGGERPSQTETYDRVLTRHRELTVNDR